MKQWLSALVVLAVGGAVLAWYVIRQDQQPAGIGQRLHQGSSLPGIFLHGREIHFHRTGIHMSKLEYSYISVNAYFIDQAMTHGDHACRRAFWTNVRQKVSGGPRR